MNYQTFWQADYDSFGKCTIISESTKNNLRFPGQYYHVVNDISANWYRDFHCQLGRYIEIEPSRYIVSSDGLVFFRDDENYNFYSYTLEIIRLSIWISMESIGNMLSVGT